MLSAPGSPVKTESPLPENKLQGGTKKDAGKPSGTGTEPSGPHPSRVGTNWHYGLVLLAILGFNLIFLPNRKRSDMIDYSAFKEKIRSGSIKRVEINKDILVGYPTRMDDLKKMDAQKRSNAEKEAVKTVLLDEPGMIRLMDSVKAEYNARPVTGQILSNIVFNWVIPGLIFFALFKFMSRKMGGMGQGMMSFGKSRAHAVSVKDMGVTFGDVAGVEEAKEELMEVIDFLKQPEKYTAVGGKIPRGVLLVGPPGTGKTLLAKAVAGEAKVPFFQISGAEFVEMIVGVGAARVRDMFKEARAQAPCILFIDELDAIGKSRSSSLISNDEREQTLNQLLVEMQGFDTQASVIVLAATNRPDVLDPALLRPGRFDRHILVDRPDLEGRTAILKIHARNVALDLTVDLQEVARKTPGFVGADLANIVNEAALLTVRAGRKKILFQDFDEAIEKTVSGLKKKNRLINPKEKETVAYHESGHALVAAFTPGADKVEKISIIPRGFGALGFTMQLPTEERYLATESQLLTRIDVLLGGRASEKLMLGEISTGAGNDLSQATEIARQMIVDYGMNEKYHDVVFHATSMGPSRNAAKEPSFQREYSESTQQYIDEQIARIIHERGEKVRVLLQDKQELIHKVAKELIQYESLTGERFLELIESKNSESLIATRRIR